MSHDARSVANKLIEVGVNELEPFTPLQIIKLVYICHGWMLGLYEQKLIKQSVYAWRYGPVVPDIYHALKQNRMNGVTERLSVKSANFNEYESDIIKQVIDVYGNLTGIQLSQITHAEGTPWYQVWTKHGINSRIPNKLIQRHYFELASSSN